MSGQIPTYDAQDAMQQLKKELRPPKQKKAVTNKSPAQTRNDRLIEEGFRPSRRTAPDGRPLLDYQPRGAHRKDTGMLWNGAFEPHTFPDTSLSPEDCPTFVAKKLQTEQSQAKLRSFVGGYDAPPTKRPATRHKNKRPIRPPRATCGYR